MATFKYPYTVKANGKIIPPNTEVEIEDTHDTVGSDSIEVVIESVDTPEKRTTKKKA